MSAPGSYLASRLTGIPTVLTRPPTRQQDLDEALVMSQNTTRHLERPTPRARAAPDNAE